jgi:predicted nucleic acid-binding protein
VDDHHHARFDAIVKELSVGGLRLITTWPCIVEASYLLEIPQRFEMLKWIELGGAVVYPIEPAHLGGIARWMRRYSESGKSEMDLADASLYWLAAETGVTEVLGQVSATLGHSTVRNVRLSFTRRAAVDSDPRQTGQANRTVSAWRSRHAGHVSRPCLSALA